jgi:mannitol 2-dehydrogenase
MRTPLAAATAWPGYDRIQLTLGTMHISVGDFRRAYFAVYLDDLFALGDSFDRSE